LSTIPLLVTTRDRAFGRNVKLKGETPLGDLVLETAAWTVTRESLRSNVQPLYSKPAALPSEYRLEAHWWASAESDNPQSMGRSAASARWVFWLSRMLSCHCTARLLHVHCEDAGAKAEYSTPFFPDGRLLKLRKKKLRSFT
jgi:hypothetical protein